MKTWAKAAARVVAGVLLLSLLVGGGAFGWLATLAPGEGDLAGKLGDAEAELQVREAALKACSGTCEAEQRAVDKQRALVDVIRQEL